MHQSLKCKFTNFTTPHKKKKSYTVILYSRPVHFFFFLQNTSLTCEANRSGSSYRLDEYYQVDTPPFPSCVSVRAHKMFGSAPNSTYDHTATPTTASASYSTTIISDSSHGTANMSTTPPNPTPSFTPEHTSVPIPDHTPGTIPDATTSSSYHTPIRTPMATPSHMPTPTPGPEDQFMRIAEMALQRIGTEIAAAYTSSSSSSSEHCDSVFDTCMGDLPSSAPIQDGQYSCQVDRNRSFLFARGWLVNKVKLLNYSIDNIREYNQVHGFEGARWGLRGEGMK